MWERGRHCKRASEREGRLTNNKNSNRKRMLEFERSFHISRDGDDGNSLTTDSSSIGNSSSSSSGIL